MGKTFYKQPNGLMTIFSTNSDRPIYWNVNKEDYINLKLEEYKEQLERDAKEIFDDEDPYYVKDFEEMKDQIIHNYEDNKADFEQYLKDVGYEGSIEDFKYLYGINYRPWEDEEEIEDEDDEDDDFKNDIYDISYAR